MADLRVQSGAVIALRLFDIAYSIDLQRVEALWSEGSGRSSSRSRLTSTPTKALTFDVPPVLLTLEPVTLDLGGIPYQASVSARLYDFGVVALSVRVQATDLGWMEYSSLCDAVDRGIGPNACGGPWKTLLEEIKTSLAPALHRPNDSTLEEDHLVAVVQKWDRPVAGAELPELVDLVPILSGETRLLSEKTRKDLLKQRFSYYDDDLVVITWDRAFIYEPRSDSDVSDILEVANAQLLEFRYYDELLDDELPRMYELVKQARRATNLLAPRRFGDLARNLYTLVAEVTELTEKADNVLQVTEDVYLARIYLAALEIFRVPRVSAAVDRKLSIVRDTYAALYAEASGSRGELLEVAIVVLIVIEIVIALLHHTV
jgi:hypothetical protein